MSWLLIAALAWVAVSVPTALLLGRALRRADVDWEGQSGGRAPGQQDDVLPTDGPSAEPPAPWTGPSTVPFPLPPGAPRRRPRVIRDPLHPTERDPSARDSRDSGPR